jgi:hypothetical protein
MQTAYLDTIVLALRGQASFYSMKLGPRCGLLSN